MLAEYLIIVCNFCFAAEASSTFTEKDTPNIALPAANDSVKGEDPSFIFAPVCGNGYVATIKAKNHAFEMFPSLKSDKCRDHFNENNGEILSDCEPVCEGYDTPSLIPISAKGLIESGKPLPGYIPVCGDNSIATVEAEYRDFGNLPDPESDKCRDYFYNNNGEILSGCKAVCKDFSNPKAIPISSYNANKSSNIGGQQINLDSSIHALSFWDMLPNCLKEEWKLEHWMVFTAVVVLIICIHYCYSDTINLFSLTSLALVILVFFAGVKSGMFGLYKSFITKSFITDNLPFLTPSNDPFAIFLKNLSVVLVTYIPCLCILNSLVNVGYEPTKQQYPGRNVTIKRVVCHEEEI